MHEILRSARGLGAGSETLPFQPTHSCWLTRFPRCAAKNPALTVAEYSIVRGKARRRMGHLPWAQVCFSRSGTACGQAVTDLQENWSFSNVGINVRARTFIFSTYTRRSTNSPPKTYICCATSSALKSRRPFLREPIHPPPTHTHTHTHTRSRTLLRVPTPAVVVAKTVITWIRFVR